VNVKVWLKLPVVAMRMTQPVKELEVVNCTLAEAAPVAIVTEVGMVNAALVGLSLTMVGEVAGADTEMRQLPEIPGVRTLGVQESDKGLGAAAGVREMVAVDFAAPKVAVMTAFCEVVIVAADAVKVAEAAPSATVRVAWAIVNRVGRLLEMETATPPAGAILERVTVQVALALEARVVGAH
jgi:hypothetical protein